MNSFRPAKCTSSLESRARWMDIVQAQEQGTARTLPNADILADRLRVQARQLSAPVDLARIVGEWPGLAVNVEELDGTGYLLDLGEQGGEILLRSQDSRPRRRFTLAHELGHWLLGPPAGAVGAIGHDISRVERWCEQFSVDLLLPANWIRADVARLKGTGSAVARMVSALPSKYGVSRSAAFLRIAELSDISILLRDWTRPPGPLSGLFISQRLRATGPLLAVKRWAEEQCKPNGSPLLVPPEGGPFATSVAILPGRRELVVTAYPRLAD